MMEEMSKKLRFLLQTQGVSYKLAAEYLGLPGDHFQGILDGLNKPTPRQLARLAQLCNVTPDFFADQDLLVEDYTNPRRAEDRPPAAPGPHKALTIADLAVRFQAICECLVDAKILTAAQMKQKVEEVAARTERRLRAYQGTHKAVKRARTKA